MNINTESLFNMQSATIEFTGCEESVKIKTPSHDESFGLIVRNNSDADGTVVIKGGNSVLAMGDLSVLVKSGEYTLINLKETGRFKNVHGENAGYIVIEIDGVTSSDIEIFPFSL